MDDDETVINKGLCSAADVLQSALEKKLMLQSEDKDRVVMLHEIHYTKGEKKYKATSSFILEGEDGKHTAMAKTVGLPLALAAKAILKGNLTLKGLHIPIIEGIYILVLDELCLNGICFQEQITEIK
jgi:saccharopine dehydrogenase-like NADP-dependent oxidoreductase